MIEKLKNLGWGTWIAIAVIIVSIVAMVFFVTSKSGAEDEFNEKTMANNEEIYRLRDSLNEVNSFNNELDSVDMEQVANSSEDMGEDIADIQNSYLKGDVPAEENAIRMDEYLGDGFENLRVPWSNIPQEATVNPTWKYISVYEFSGARMDVVWVLTDDDDNLYGYAAGTYNTTDNILETLEVERTAIGLAAESDYGSGTPGVNLSPEDIEKLAKESPTDDSENSGGLIYDGSEPVR